MEDTVLFPSQSIRGKETGIEQFNSLKIEGDIKGDSVRRGKRIERMGTWKTKMECVFLREREKASGGETVIG